MPQIAQCIQLKATAINDTHETVSDALATHAHTHTQTHKPPRHTHILPPRRPDHDAAQRAMRPIQARVDQYTCRQQSTTHTTPSAMRSQHTRIQWTRRHKLKRPRYASSQQRTSGETYRVAILCCQMSECHVGTAHKSQKTSTALPIKNSYATPGADDSHILACHRNMLLPMVSARCELDRRSVSNALYACRHVSAVTHSTRTSRVYILAVGARRARSSARVRASQRPSLTVRACVALARALA